MTMAEMVAERVGHEVEAERDALANGVCARTHASAAERGHRFIAETVIPALEEARTQVERGGATARVVNCQTHARLLVARDGQSEFSYAVRLRLEEGNAVPYSEASGRYGSHWRWSDSFGCWDTLLSPIPATATPERAEITRHAQAWYAEERARR